MQIEVFLTSKAAHFVDPSRPLSDGQALLHFCVALIALLPDSVFEYVAKRQLYLKEKSPITLNSQIVR